MQTVVLTACSNRKREATAPELCARTLSPAPLESFGEAWLQRLASGRSVLAASDLYCGRGFREAEQAAAAAGARLFVVSAGLGLIDSSTLVPSYSLTLSRSSPDALQAKTSTPPSQWWGLLTRRSPFSTGEFDAGGLILAALSRPYLDLVADEWAAWPAERLARLRIFTYGGGGGLPPALAAAAMPYDKRLEGCGGGYAGTGSDFAQRAMRHFVDVVPLRADLGIAGHAEAVLRSLEPFSPREIPQREKMADQELVELIVREWDSVGGRSGEMLRRLRRGLGVACEQGRFKALFSQAAAARLGVLL